MTMKTTLTALSIVGLLVAAAQANVIPVPDYSLVPDGTEYGDSGSHAVFEDQRFDVNAANGGTIVNGSFPVVFLVSTFSFGEDTGADVNLNFTASLGQSRLGIQVKVNGEVRSTGDGQDSLLDYDFGSSLAGQDVTIIGKFEFDANNNVAYGRSNNSEDSFATFWINPTTASEEGSGWKLLPGNPPTDPNPNLKGDFTSNLWNSSSFHLLRQRIDNNGTPETAGTTSILDTTILTGDDATFENALLAAGIPEPASLALMGLGGLMMVKRRR